MMLQTTDEAFAIAPEDQVVLRVLSGVQLGAEMSLMPAEYIIGSGDEADIILADAALKWKHAGITVDAEGASIEAIEGTVMVDGDRIDPGKRRQLDMPATVVIGLLIIGIGKLTTDWSEVELPDVREKGDEDEDPEDDLDDETEDEDAPDSRDDDEDPSEAESPEEADTEPELKAEPDARPKQRTRGSAILGIVLVFLLVIGVGGYALIEKGYLSFSNPEANQNQEVVLTPAQRVQEVISALSLRELEVGDPIGLGLTISGYVETFDQHDALTQALAEQNLTPIDRVRIVEKMMDTLLVTLASVDWPEPNYDQHLVVTHEGEGRIVIDGFLGPEVDRSSLRRRLESDVPGISFLRFTRSDLRSWRSVLIDMIEDAKLSDWLTTSPDGANIRVDGELTARQARIWQQVGERFTVESRGRPRITIGVTALPEWQPIAEAEEAVTPQATTVATETPASQPVVEVPSVILEKFDAQPVVAPAPAAPIVKIIPRPNFVVIGIIVSDEGDSIALLSNGASVRQGDRFDGGAYVAEVKSDRVTVRAGDNTYTYHVRRR